MSEQPTSPSPHGDEPRPDTPRSRGRIVAVVGVVLALALATSGFTLVGLQRGSDAGRAAPAPAWLTPPGTGGTSLTPMPGGAPAVPAMTADASAPTAPPAALIAATGAAASPAVSTGGTGGGTTGSGAGDSPLVAQPMQTGALPAATNPVSGAVSDAGTGVGGLASKLPTAPSTSTTSTPPSTSTTTTKPTTTTTPALPACTATGPLTLTLVFGGGGYVTSVVLSGLAPTCGPVVVQLQLAGQTTPFAEFTSSSGTVTVTLPGPVLPTDVGQARVLPAA